MNLYCILLLFLLLHLIISCQGAKSKSKKENAKEEENDEGASFKLESNTEQGNNQILVGSGIPYLLQLQVYKHLFSSYFAYEKSIYEEVQLNCKSDITSKVLRKYPMSLYVWMFNGVLLKESDKIDVKNGKVEIKNATKSNDGVYVCKLEYSTEKLITMAIFSLVIDSGKTDFKVNKLRPFKRLCPSIVFGLLFKKATKEWRFNGTYYERLGRTSARDFSKANFAPLNENMTGKWDCVVKDGTTEREWTVMSFNMVVKNPILVGEQVKLLFKEKPVLFLLLMVSPVMAVFLVILFVCYRPSPKEGYEKLAHKKGDDKALQNVIAESEESGIEESN